KTSDLEDCEIIFLSQDVETDSKNKSNFYKINSLLNNVVFKIKNKKTLLILLSQVEPGFTRKINFDKERLFYQVETLIVGESINSALYPKRLIIGCDKKGKELPIKYRMVLEAFNCPILKMSYESAELSKISINCYLASSVLMTNTLAEASRAIGANWNDIASALKLDPRIGEKAYLKPGLGISGGNLERDLISLIKLSKTNDFNEKLIQSLIETSNYHSKWILKELENKIFKFLSKPKISILGLTYKEGTASIKNSPSIKIINSLSNYDLFYYDP
ncbi:MAG: hypothetical protein ACKOAD_00670, partial [Gammaproteobacteria bacterium]